MKTLSRQEVREAFNKIVAKYGNPKSGGIYCEDQLIAAIAINLCTFDETNITYEYGEFSVSPNIVIKSKYGSDNTFIGTVKAKEWYTPEQIKAMHEIGFGYMF